MKPEQSINQAAPRPDTAHKQQIITVKPMIKVRRGKEGDAQRPIEEEWEITGYHESSGNAIVERIDGTARKVIPLSDPDLMIENRPFSAEFQNAKDFEQLFAALGSGGGELWDPDAKTMVSVQSIKRLINQIREEKQSIVMLPNIPGMAQKVQELDLAERPHWEQQRKQEQTKALATLQERFAHLETFRNPMMQIVSASERAATGKLWFTAFQEYLEALPTEEALKAVETRYQQLPSLIKNFIDDTAVQDHKLRYQKTTALRELRRMVRPDNPLGATYNGFVKAVDRVVNLLGEVTILTKPEAEELYRMMQSPPRGGAKVLGVDKLAPLREALKQKYQL